MNGDQLRIGLIASTAHHLETFHVQSAEVWRSEGCVVRTAAGTASTEFSDHAVLPGITRAPSPARVVRAIGSLRQWVLDERLDVVVTNTANSSAIARMARLSVPVVYFCHGLHWSEPAPARSDILWRTAERWLGRRSAGIICMNSVDEAWLATNLPAVPLLRLPWGIGLDPVRYPRSPRPDRKPMRLVWAGELNGRKNPMAALETARELRARGIEVTLDLLGVGQLRPTVDAYIKSQDLADVVTVPGLVDVTPYLTDATAVFMTSSWEGLPRILLEALAVGRPIAGFECKGVADLTPHRVPHGDVRALASVLQDMHEPGFEMSYPDPNELSYVTAAHATLSFIRRVVSDG